jgi:hypothetical protein
MNKLFQQLNPQNNANPQLQNSIAGVKRMMNTFRMATNPKQALQSAMEQNPQVQQAMGFVRQLGGDPKTAFYKLAEQKGVDPNEVLNALK